MSRNAPALGSVLAGLLAAAAIPATVAYAYWSDRLPLIWAGVAVPAAILLACSPSPAPDGASGARG